MKKFYSLFAAVVLAVSVNAQTTKTLTINTANIGGTTVLQTSNYGSGAERTWATNSINFGGKAITGTAANTPVTGPAGAHIQSQGNNAVFYNVSALPGRIVSVTINYVGTARNFAFSGGNTSRLVNSTAADYTVTGGTAVGAASSTGWTSTDFEGTNYTYFAIKSAVGNTAYITSIDIVYEEATMAVDNASAIKANLVKNTVVNNAILFAAKADVQIVNMNGQVVKSASVNENTSLEVASLPKGTYIVTGNVNGKAVSQKIIKK
ncbi:T9SS type A sorting domain-containing protein [Kaistella sp. DKR-2]|uniref:T9SS type A sorting domain-containing protein n=1 Tax=Kaistella soli TaxID=2849654 RepID=UPI001C25BBF0|nr:T9SS type A sorting domain-containing protein [Kaistella soli]MBU8881646.1 T9SS type A sorting domain-containing protein [Kaistella soli]